ncbi:phospholipase D [Pseudomonas aeruginosa]|uniref:phospholipase D n=1 Tax=Pseudomonas aeruginosa TaxID=287 RepID=UPI0021F244C2|nr:phospholipase D [Pseudomonas aeruginosa]MCV4114778.1 phospholipase D [Pseudomonas aeruginosa]MCV4247326.1 phospholipase D [Pseudomonas aeruginosa]MCV4253662.1 phospholipase D [Pseudomonas aeruginosa]
MLQKKPYNGLHEKELNQINRQDGSPCVAISAPGCFIKGPNLFSEKRAGNRVRFFTTGRDYFSDLTSALDSASSSIFITGWQVNYDVLLDGRRSLWQCLRRALERSPALKVYVMPWLSPSGSLGTYDFETMLAVFQLNAGLEGGARAFCTPAIQQSDMKGLGVAFSHHQKSVVIDNRIGYVGGIDLAYGRRDDNDFSLDASGRRGNDAYNPGLPHLGWMAEDEHVSSMGLMMATLFDLSRPLASLTLYTPTIRLTPIPHVASSDKPFLSIPLAPSRARALNGAAYLSDLFRGPMLPSLQWIGRAYNSSKEGLDEGFERFDAFRRQMVASSIRAIANLIADNLDALPIEPELERRLRAWLEELRTAALNLPEALRIKSLLLINQWMSETELGQVLTLISGKGFEDIPQNLSGKAGELAGSLFWTLHGLLQARAGGHQQPYRYLNEAPQPLASPDNARLAADQPRMPWQDVHCRIEGPSVYDLARNFIDRWNGQQAYLAKTPALQDTALVRSTLEAVMKWLNSLAAAAGLENYLDEKRNLRLELDPPTPCWINAPEQLPQEPEVRRGGMTVQVLRSAAARMLEQEQAGRLGAGVNLPLQVGVSTEGVQSNCKAAMLQAISGAQQFIYIENQFFQSEFGEEGELRRDQEQALSGPMASLRDVGSLRRDFVARVRLEEALEQRDLWLLDWAEVEKIAQEPGAEARQFLKSMLAMWGVNAQGWLTHKLGEAQHGLLNEIGEALARRIERAIQREHPFHVYLVLPVHPEGALNVPNIMHQVHLTQQSLMFGEQSLVKRIQRQMALKALEGKADPAQAREIIERKDTRGRPVYEQQDWSRYLTLLNLRSWAVLGGRVVTEQVYVHSKLLIADDRVAILGSANINDRSLQGERDSELAVMVRDSEPLTAKLDGKNDAVVGKAIHQLRVDLWKKHFGLSQEKGGFVKPASELSAYLSMPAAQEAWEAIQILAKENTRAYERAFNFIPQNISQTQLQLTPEPPKGFEDGFPASIWPTWAYRSPDELREGGQLMEAMPYQEMFWRSSTLTSVKTFPAPNGVSGFITALPTNWTRGERNDSGLNLSILAHQDGSSRTTQVAMNGDSSEQGRHRT